MLSACHKGGNDPVPAVDPVLYDVSYGLTRAGADAPADGTAYTFVSYAKSGDTYNVNPNWGSNQRPVGHYAYLADEIDYHGILQPCVVTNDGVTNTTTGIPTPIAPYEFEKRDNDSKWGQGLLNNDYRTVCIYPAKPLVPNGYGSYRVLLSRDEVLMASDPFDMQVQGYQIFELGEEDTDGCNKLPIHDVRSKVLLDIVQGTNNTFTITDPVLENAGVWGWYHPLLQITSISYDDSTTHTPPDGLSKGSGMYNVYDKTENPTAGSNVQLVISEDDPSAGTSDLYLNTSAQVKDGVVYTTGSGDDDGLFFFANDYPSDNFLQPGISFTLDMGGSQFPITIPLSIKMERNVCYYFRLTVESVVISVTFQKTGWISAGNDDTIGYPAPEILGTWELTGWVPGYTDPNEEIGGSVAP